MAHKVFLGIPCYGGKVDHRMIGSVIQSGPELARLQTSTYSILTHNFNILYAAALNERANGITHFCLAHADIVINTPGWLTKMCKLMDEHKADILSVVSPIKDKRGLTSTAQDNGTWQPERFSMTDIMNLPETFTMPGLLVNSALMLVNIWSFTSTLLRFEFKDAILHSDKGYHASVFPEDWGFSRMAWEHGLKVYATREINLEHVGTTHYSNQFAWGTEK